MSPEIARRDFLGRLGNALAGLTISAGLTSSSQNDLAHAFPSQLVGARTIEHFPVQGAKQVLVHVRQTHEHPLSNDLSRGLSSMSPEIMDWQSNIRALLDYLARELPCRYLFVEGVSLDAVSEVNRTVAQLRASRAGYTKLEEQLHGLLKARDRARPWPDLERATETIEQRSRESHARYLDLCRQLDKRSIALSTACQVAARRDLEILSPNTPDIESLLRESLRPIERLNELSEMITGARTEAIKVISSCNALTSQDSEEFKKLAACLKGLSDKVEDATSEQRAIIDRLSKEEDLMSPTLLESRAEAVLSIMEKYPAASRNPDIFLMLYGMGHDFRDNVAHYNALRPDRPISLVVITPFGL